MVNQYILPQQPYTVLMVMRIPGSSDSVALLLTAFTLSCGKDGYEGHLEKTSATFNLMTAALETTLK